MAVLLLALAFVSICAPSTIRKKPSGSAASTESAFPVISANDGCCVSARTDSFAIESESKIPSTLVPGVAGAALRRDASVTIVYPCARASATRSRPSVRLPFFSHGSLPELLVK